MRSICTLSGTKHAVADFIFPWATFSWESGDYTCELGPPDPRKGRLVLIFASDLEQVEEVCSRGVDFDEVRRGRRGRRWEGANGEVERTLSRLNPLVNDFVP